MCGMPLPTKQDLIALVRGQEGPHVSLYLPTHRLGSETQEDRIHLKNLMTAAEDGLVETGMRRTVAKDMLAPVAALELDSEFWQHQDGGLAVFVNEAGEQHFTIPVAVPELVLVEPCFHLKPLLRLLSSEASFHVLAISANRTHLLACTAFSQSQVRLEHMPRGIADVLWPDDNEKQNQFHSFYSAASGGGTAVVHGAGGSEPDRKGELLRYFRQVDAVLAPHMREAGGTLVLACVDFLAPIYSQANSYAHLSERHVSGSPDRTADEALRVAAWELLKPDVDASRERALGRYRELAGTGQTTSDPAEAALAAISGKIDTAFVTLGQQVWGHVDEAAYKAEAHAEAAAGDYDLLDLVAAQTLKAGGTVYAVDQASAPEPTGVAAVFRYAG
jgi:hypothetical protein